MRVETIKEGVLLDELQGSAQGVTGFLTELDNRTQGQQEPAVAKKVNRHVVITLNRMNQRRKALVVKRAQLTKEIEELDEAILALG